MRGALSRSGSNPMISRNEFNAYNLAVEQIGNKAASDVESSVLN